MNSGMKNWSLITHNIFLFFHTIQDWKKFVNVDGLHLAKLGGDLLYRLLVEKLSPLTAGCKEMFPNWSEVDTVEPSASLKNWSAKVRQL